MMWNWAILVVFRSLQPHNPRHGNPFQGESLVHLATNFEQHWLYYLLSAVQREGWDVPAIEAKCGPGMKPAAHTFHMPRGTNC